MSSERVTQAERSNYTLARTFVSDLPSGPITVHLMQQLDLLADDRIAVADAETCQHCGGDLRLPPEVAILGTPPEHYTEPDEPPTETSTSTRSCPESPGTRCRSPSRSSPPSAPQPT